MAQGIGLTPNPDAVTLFTHWENENRTPFGVLSRISPV